MAANFPLGILSFFDSVDKNVAFAASPVTAQDVSTYHVGVGAVFPRRSQRRRALDYVQPSDLLNEAVKAASRKVSLSVRDLLIRSFLVGGLLAYATSLVFIVLSQNIVPIVGAILFPVGFVILVLLGLELATGNFAILPAGWAAGEVTLPGMFRNLGRQSRGHVAAHHDVFCARLRTLHREHVPDPDRNIVR
jgi:hypothetical protein